MSQMVDADQALADRMVPRRGKGIRARTDLKTKENFITLDAAVYQSCDPVSSVPRQPSSLVEPPSSSMRLARSMIVSSVIPSCRARSLNLAFRAASSLVGHHG